jgi:hypothetical protein
LVVGQALQGEDAEHSRPLDQRHLVICRDRTRQRLGHLEEGLERVHDRKEPDGRLGRLKFVVAHDGGR